MFEQKRTFRSRRREVRQMKRRMVYSGAAAFVVLLLGIGVWYGARRDEVTIVGVTVEGGETVSHETVAAKVDSILSGTYVLLLPRRFTYLYPQNEIVDAVNSIPRVHDARVEKLSRTELKVTFDEYIPFALWCDGVPAASSTPRCVFLNEDGLAFADAPSLRGETLMRFVLDEKEPRVGEYVYDRDALAHFQAFAHAIEEKHGDHVKALTETKDGDVIIHLSNEVNLLATRELSVDDIFSHVESLFASDEFKDRTLEEFEYIDLRFGNKVYAKERGVADAVALAPATSTDAAVTATLSGSTTGAQAAATAMQPTPTVAGTTTAQ